MTASSVRRIASRPTSARRPRPAGPGMAPAARVAGQPLAGLPSLGGCAAAASLAGVQMPGEAQRRQTKKNLTPISQFFPKHTTALLGERFVHFVSLQEHAHHRQAEHADYGDCKTPEADGARFLKDNRTETDAEATESRDGVNEGHK